MKEIATKVLMNAGSLFLAMLLLFLFMRALGFYKKPGGCGCGGGGAQANTNYNPSMFF